MPQALLSQKPSKMPAKKLWTKLLLHKNVTRVAELLHDKKKIAFYDDFSPLGA